MEDAAQLFNTNASTNNKNDKTDDEHTNKHINLEEYPSYPHTSGRMGAMAIYCPIGVGVVVVVVVVWFWV